MNELRSGKSNVMRIALRGSTVNDKQSKGGWIVAIIIILLLVVGGLYLARNATTADGSKSPAQPASGAETDTSQPIEHPIEQATAAPASASTAPLPALGSSDESVVSALATFTGDSDLSALLMQPRVVQRIVATVDALPRSGLNRVLLPVRPPTGAFATEEVSGSTVMSSQNDARYAPYMKVVQEVEPDKLVAWYVHAYPLFQQAYRQLGYPKGYFNDRVIVAIDNLLATPDLAQRPSLVLSNGYYRYADPKLESLSSGQRAVLRAGPVNEAKLKARLREVRSLLVGQDFHPGTAPAAPQSAG